MISDARTVDSNTTLEADICIIGAGPAGITLAREFDGTPFRVLLLEGGDIKYDRASQSLYKGENIGLYYEDLDQTRSRYLGGSSNCWGGFCRPLDEHDFEVRDWIPNSGWPIKRDDLVPYYRRAQAMMHLGPFNYEASTWENWVNRSEARLIRFDRKRAVNLVAQLSAPTRFGLQYKDEIAQSRNISLYLNANVTEIETPGNGSQVTGLRVCVLNGRSFRAVANTYILATGGIETPRLLLASNRHQPCGVGNQHDLVGRYFMDHPRLRTGEIVFRDPEATRMFYDFNITFAGKIAARGVKLAGFFGLTPETQQAERIGNTRCYVKSCFVGDSPETRAALQLLFRALKGRASLRDRRASEIWNMISHLPHIAALAAGISFKLPFLGRGFELETVVEPTPLPESRVMLGPQRDRLGLPQVRVDWRLGDVEKRTFRRTQEILGEELARSGAGQIVLEAPQEKDTWPESLKGCWHHMGTARMHTDPRSGVVDTDCRVHGMTNLYIAGSSVFPTCGMDMPTLTIVALALRLAEHLKTHSRGAHWSRSPATAQTAGLLLEDAPAMR
ncbi:Glucose-methanol-choline (GMC) oxidoreductase:NAD binding site [Rhodovastum atsumiense]|uniref:GMC family oxidoreductase n=1 Tax=Rhodovastum atsumiense TaxID=504468 RepID=A0A5M6J201_9PROT|nr:GMC family oxidoreductase [Rhodovastum atsumiense]KAA5614633.1 GMC family oxidoreductase [Rhodovastum atsumiense]CAH2599852.1 Glucose-methanol-choline (GMC) oxidoreductase:NAD binding site [Rhodovastum atsumiense]